MDSVSYDECLYTDSHNPPAHIMVTVRPLKENGTWQQKTEKEYLCVRDGKEQGFTAAEFKTTQKEGWEKQYQYKAGKKKVFMTPSAAEAQGLERVSKYPKSTKCGRQNPITARWNGEEYSAPGIRHGYGGQQLFSRSLQHPSYWVMPIFYPHLRKAQLARVAQNHGFRLIFLPPYSPEFNPIEKFWAWLKRFLHSSLSSSSSFDAALFDAFQVC